MLEARPPVRVLERDGRLMSAQVSLITRPGMAGPATVQLCSSEPSRLIKLLTPKATLSLRVELPYVAVRKRVGGDNDAWRSEHLRFTLDELLDDACLDLRLPAAIIKVHPKIPELVARNSVDEDEAIQTITGKRVGEIYRYHLSALADTVHVHGGFRIWLKLLTHGAVVAVVPDPKPASGAEIDGTHLRLTGRAARGRLRVLVHVPSAPWLAPQVAELAEGADEIPLAPPALGRERTARHRAARGGRTAAGLARSGRPPADGRPVPRGRPEPGAVPGESA